MSAVTNNHIESTVLPPPTVQTLIEEANAMNASRSRDKADKSYQREWKKFIEFVTEK